MRWPGIPDPIIWKKVVDHFRYVLAILPNDFLALLYMGHNPYDVGDYAAARPFFLGAKSVAPKTYIGLRAHEMVLCCGIMSNGIVAALDELEAFVCEGSSSCYVLEDIAPIELGKALERVLIGPAMNAEQVAKAERLADRLDELGHFANFIGALVRMAKFRNVL